MRRIHFGPDRRRPFVTLCGAGKPTKRWRSVDISHERAAVDCPTCKRLLTKEGTR